MLVHWSVLSTNGMERTKPISWIATLHSNELLCDRIKNGFATFEELSVYVIAVESESCGSHSPCPIVALHPLDPGTLRDAVRIICCSK